MIRRGSELVAQAGLCAPGDHRREPRRRGPALHQATRDELKEVGHAQLTMERVATRAHASKASLYRRWPSWWWTRLIDPGESLTLDVLRRALPRGEIRPGALGRWVATAGPTLLRQHFMLNGEIVDEVVLPLVRP